MNRRCDRCKHHWEYHNDFIEEINFDGHRSFYYYNHPSVCHKDNCTCEAFIRDIDIQNNSTAYATYIKWDYGNLFYFRCGSCSYVTNTHECQELVINGQISYKCKICETINIFPYNWMTHEFCLVRWTKSLYYKIFG